MRIGILGVAFALIASIGGIVLIVGIPPGMGLDEPQHYARAWSVSHGHLVAIDEPGGRVGDIIPDCDWAFVGRINHDATDGDAPTTFSELNARNVCDPKGRIFVPHENTAVNSPVGYLPQAGALAVARAIGLPSGATFYAGRLAGLVLYVLLGTTALALAPRGRPLLFAVGVFPMSLLQAATYSADTAVIGLALLLTALVLRALVPAASPVGNKAVDPEVRRRAARLWAAAVVVGIALSLSKNTLVAVTPVLLLVPTAWSRSRRTEALVRIASVGVCVAAAAAWYLVVRHVSLAAFRVPAVIDPAAQARSLVTRPQHFARILFHTVTATDQEQPVFRTTTWMMNPLRRRGDFAPPTWLAALALLHLLAAGRADRGRPRVLGPVDRARALLPLAVVVGCASVAVVSLWLTWTGVGSNAVYGLQGRYLVPLLPFLAIGTAIRFEEAVLTRTRTRTRITMLRALALLAALGAGVWLHYWR